MGRATPVRRVRFPSTSATIAACGPANPHPSRVRWGLRPIRARVGGRMLRTMKKLIMLLVVIALVAVAAKKLKDV